MGVDFIGVSTPPAIWSLRRGNLYEIKEIG
jgi:hypothetical protein